jgi:hypothetical protein
MQPVVMMFLMLFVVTMSLMQFVQIQWQTEVVTETATA